MGSPKVLVTLENTDLVVMSGKNMSSSAILTFPSGEACANGGEEGSVSWQLHIPMEFKFTSSAQEKESRGLQVWQ